MRHSLAFSEDDRAFIEQCCLFFLATADAEGQPDVSYKGGLPGFVRVTGESTLAFPDYDGNGQFRSLGNILVNPRVGMIFMDFQGQRRKRVKGTASRALRRPAAGRVPRRPGRRSGCRRREVFGNCPRYIHKMELRRALRLRPTRRSHAASAGLEAERAVSATPCLSETHARPPRPPASSDGRPRHRRHASAPDVRGGE